MEIVTMRQLLEAGVHFGHQTRRWNPKMKRYIYAERNGIYIIDLQQTLQLLIEAYNYVKKVASEGGIILFVGTKKQTQDTIELYAKECGMPYVRNRWIGGTLTNFETVSRRVRRLDEIEEMERSGKLERLPKKEVLEIRKEYEKLLYNMGGIRDMKRLPDVLYVVDPHKEEIAVNEARKLKIPIVAITDTNCDPDKVDYVIPGNDDAIRSCSLITSIISDAIKKGKQEGEALKEAFEEVEKAAPEELVTKKAQAEPEPEKVGAEKTGAEKVGTGKALEFEEASEDELEDELENILDEEV